MALQVSFSIQELIDSSGWVFFETTGAYSATNPTGYGSPNPAWSTAYYAKLEMFDYLGTPIGTAQQYPFTDFDSSPTSTVWPVPRMQINGTDFGLNPIPDGVYQFKYTALQTEDGTVLSTATIYVLFYAGTMTNLTPSRLNFSFTSEECMTQFGDVISTYLGLIESYSFQVQSGGYAVADAGIRKLQSDSNSLCIIC